MITLLSLLWAQLLYADVQCKLITGYDIIVVRAETKMEAKTEARLKCGELLIDRYLRRNKTINDDQIDELITYCVNLECQ